MVKSIEKAEENFRLIFSDVNKIEAQILIMFFPLSQIILLEYSGEEKPVKYGINEVWNNYSFLCKRVIYHMKNYINSINKALKFLDSLSSVNMYTMMYEPISNSIAFEFESLISAFNKLIEQPTPDEIKRVLNSEIEKQFPSDLICKNNIDGFYWRLNILRNRVVHPDVARYSKMIDGVAGRFEVFTSKPRICGYFEDRIELKCNLFDLKENPEIKKIIKDKIISKDNKSNVMDILFPQKSPKGRMKKTPFLLDISHELAHFDYLNSFYDLTQEMLDYMNKINHLFMKQITYKCNKSIFQENIGITQDEKEVIIKIQDVYDLS